MWKDENFVGGHPALDFINTVGDTDKSRADNRLNSPDGLLSWINASGVAKSDLRPSQADVDALVQFRELTYHVLSALVRNGIASTNHLRKFEDHTKSAVDRATLSVSTAPALWSATQDPAFHYIDSFALLVEEFLRSPDVGRLRQCERCTWFFLNSGRGRGRRWCNMSTCGNRHKVAAHRERRHADARKANERAGR